MQQIVGHIDQILMYAELAKRLDAFEQFLDLPGGVFGWRSLQPTLLRKPRLARRDQRLPPAFKQSVIDGCVNTLRKRRLVLPCATHNNRANGSLVHDDQVMVVQPA
jgi:hypothetical protein